MSDIWTTDISHFLDEDGHIIAEPARAKLFLLGYPAGEAKSGPSRKHLEEFIYYEQWRSQ